MKELVIFIVSVLAIVSVNFKVNCDQVTVFDKKFLPFLRFGREFIFQLAKSPSFARSYSVNLAKGVSVL